jgi:hypothetical protein
MLGCVLSLVLVARAAEPTWVAWLYSSHGGHAWLLADDGTVLLERADDNLPGSDSDSFPPITVSNAGRYFAYRRDRQLYVMDTITGAEILHYGVASFFDTFIRSQRRRLFSQDDKQLAFGISHWDVHTSTGGWELVILDIQTGKVLNRLNNTDPGAHVARLPGDTYLPFVQQFEGDLVSFLMDKDGI